MHVTQVLSFSLLQADSCFVAQMLTLILGVVVMISTALAQNYESVFLQTPDATVLRSHSQYYSSKPHVAGTAGDWNTVQYTVNQLNSYGGLDVSIQTFRAQVNYPVSASLAIVSPDSLMYEADLSEDILAADPTSDTWYRNHTYGGLTPSGDVEAQYVYCNYGGMDDFEWLQQQGIDLFNKIALVRYSPSGIFRGWAHFALPCSVCMCICSLKVENAQRFGVAGVIIYSDPADDGYGKGPVYPNGVLFCGPFCVQC